MPPLGGALDGLKHRIWNNNAHCLNRLALRRLSHTRCRLFPGLAFKFISLELLVVVDQTNKIMTILLGYFPAGSSHFFNGLIFKHVALLKARVV
jgi:hypothetical protein